MSSKRPSARKPLLAICCTIAATLAASIIVWTATPRYQGHSRSAGRTTPDQPGAMIPGITPSDSSQTTATGRGPERSVASGGYRESTPVSLDPATIDHLATALPEPVFAPIALSLLLKSEPGEARERLGAWIEELETDNPRPYLNGYMASNEWSVRRAVGQVLQRSADAHAVDALVRMWHDAPNDHGRAQIESFLIGMTSPAAEEAIIVALLDPARSSDLGIRRALMLGLGSVGGRIGVSTLIDWLRLQTETSGADVPLLSSALSAVRSEEGQLLLAIVAENTSGSEPVALQQQAVAALFSQPSAVAVGAIDRMSRSDHHLMSSDQLVALKKTMLRMMGP